MNGFNFVPPETLAAGETRRAELIAERLRLDAELAADKARHKGHQVTDRKVLEWRAKTVRRLTYLQTELTQVKNWLVVKREEENQESKRWGVFDDVEGQRRCEAFSRSLHELFEYVKFLERETAELRAENLRLKAMVPGEDIPI